MIERIKNEPIAVYTMSRKTDDRQADRQTDRQANQANCSEAIALENRSSR